MERIAEKNLIEKNIELPTPPAAAASYVPCVRCGNLLFLSGQGTIFNGKRLYIGAVGREQSQEDAYQAARICGLNLLAQLKKYLGSLDKVKKIVNLRGYVNSAPDFFLQPAVINGASDLMISVFGVEVGSHSRTAVGVSSLPNNITVEVELVVEIDAE